MIQALSSAFPWIGWMARKKVFLPGSTAESVGSLYAAHIDRLESTLGQKIIYFSPFDSAKNAPELQHELAQFGEVIYGRKGQAAAFVLEVKRITFVDSESRKHVFELGDIIIGELTDDEVTAIISHFQKES